MFLKKIDSLMNTVEDDIRSKIRILKGRVFELEKKKLKNKLIEYYNIGIYWFNEVLSKSLLY